VEIRTLIREGIDGKGMSQAGFARAVGVAPPLVSRWLNDAEPVVPSPANCQRIADVLGLDRRVVLAAAGHYEEGPTEEMPENPRWELEQRKLKDIYADVDEEKWAALTEAVRVVRALSVSASDDLPRPSPVSSPIPGPKWLRRARLRRIVSSQPESKVPVSEWVSGISALLQSARVDSSEQAPSPAIEGFFTPTQARAQAQKARELICQTA
jgi:transcriptional regulator with XRE-family HTH domain